MLYSTQENVIELFNDFTRIKSEAKYGTKQGVWVKILTPKQTLQRLPLSLTQIKVGNALQNLLNEIRQIIYSPYQSKKS